MTREEKLELLNRLLEIEEKNDIGNLTRTDRREFQEWARTLEQETVSKESYDHEYFLRKEFELKIDKLQRQLEEQAVKAESILDKIRADIWDLQYGDKEKSMTDEDRADAYNNAIRQVIEIIDMYKAEMEEV